MIVTISTLDLPVKVEITTPKPEVLIVGNASPINVIISVIKDGEKGEDGQPATNNTLELVRAENNSIEGNIDANGNTISNIRNAVDNQEPATLAQVNAALIDAKNYSDTVSVESVRWAGYWNASSGSLPSNSQVRRGDEFEVNVAGTHAGIEFEIGDIIRARINVPGQTIVNWSIAQGNVQQALENRQGTAKIVTGSELENENSLNDSDVVTSKKIWQNFVPKLLSLPLNWLAKQTFTVAPKLASLTAGQFLKLDNNKEIISVEKIYHQDIDSVEKFQSSLICDYSPRQVTLTGEKAFSYYKIDAGTLKVGSIIQLDTQISKTIVGNDINRSYICHNVAPTLAGATFISGATVVSNSVNWRINTELIILPDGQAKRLMPPIVSSGLTSSVQNSISFPFDISVDNYFFATVLPGNNNDVFNQIFFLIKKIN